MRQPHASTSSYRRPIRYFLGADFDRWLLSLRQVQSRRLRPAGRLTCRVQGSTLATPMPTAFERALMIQKVAQVAQIFRRVSTLSGYVRPESVSAEFSTTASEP